MSIAKTVGSQTHFRITKQKELIVLMKKELALRVRFGDATKTTRKLIAIENRRLKRMQKRG